MERKKNARRDKMQNLLIVLLSVSAVLLFIQTQISNLSWELGGGNGYSTQTTVLPDGELSTLADLAAPIQVAVSTADGHCGLSGATTDTASLSRLSTLLGSALGSASEWLLCEDAQFRAALHSGVYYDFGNDLPVSLLAELLGAESNTALSARQLILAPDGDSAKLYLRSDSGACRVCVTAVQSGALAAELENFEANEAFFAFEGGEEYKKLHPYTLLNGASAAAPVLTASDSLNDTAALLRKLDFNPNTNSRYTEVDGTEVIMEGSRTLRLQADGTVIYQAYDGDAALSVPAAAEQPTAAEAVLGTRSIAETVLADALGEAELCLESITATETGWSVRFGLHRSGVPIRFADGSCGAEFTLTGSIVERFTTHFRRYSATDETTLLVPLKQAVAMAGRWPGALLHITYVDSGAASVPLSWLAD